MICPNVRILRLFPPGRALSLTQMLTYLRLFQQHHLLGKITLPRESH